MEVFSFVFQIGLGIAVSVFLIWMAFMLLELIRELIFGKDE